MDVTAESIIAELKEAFAGAIEWGQPSAAKEAITLIRDIERQNGLEPCLLEELPSRS